MQDFDRLDDVVDAVAAGDCMAGLSNSAYNDLPQSLSDELTVLDTSIEFPYAIFMYPVNMPLGERLKIDDGLLAADTDSDGRTAMQPFLDQDGLRRVDAETFDDLTGFLDDSGLDFAQLGS